MPPYLLQPNRFSCGTLSVLNAIVSLGGESDYDTVYAAIGTTVRNGTDEFGILSGLRELGYRGWQYEGKNRDSAWRYIISHCKTHPIIVLVDDERHWVCASGMIGRRVIVIDSDPSIKKNESGALSYSKQELLERWVHRGTYYAIRVSK